MFIFSGIDETFTGKSDFLCILQIPILQDVEAPGLLIFPKTGGWIGC